jgi:hypothetical protein
MDTGIRPSEQTRGVYHDTFVNNGRLLILKISAVSKQVEVEKISDGDVPYDSFLENFHQQECCYGLYGFEVDLPDAPLSLGIFVLWAPKNASVFERTLYAASEKNVRESFDPSIVMIQATDMGELNPTRVMSKILSKLHL